MKNTFFKATVAMLAILLILPALFACANTTPEDTTAPAAATTAEPQGEETTADAFAGVNFNDTTFTYLAWKQSIVEYTGDDSKGEMIESAVFKRNSIVESKLGVKLDYLILDGSSATFNEFCQTANNNINAGSQAYDAIACYTRAASLLMVNGSLTNLYDVDYLNFDNVWWPKSLTELNTIGGELYFASGDIATSLLYQMMFMAINNDIAKEHNIEGVQELALKGEWTFDKMLELTKDMYSDRTGGATPRDATNNYGLYVYAHTMLDAFYLGAGLHYVEVDSEGNAAMSEDYIGDVSLDIIERLQTLFWSGNSSDGYYANSGGANGISAGQSLLYVINGETLQSKMKDAEYNYSILPAPKYNADQDNYYTAVGFPHSMYGIPVDAANKKMSGAVIEYMAETSYEEVTPVVFDTAFKYRYSNGAGDAEVFDIIRRGVVFDFGRTLFDQMGGDAAGPIRMWRNEIANKGSTLARLFSSNNKKWSAQLTDTLTAIKEKAHS